MKRHIIRWTAIRTFAATLTPILLTLSAFAADVGIRFDEMPVGTILVTESIGSTPLRQSEQFVGKRGEFFVTEIRRRGKDGQWSIASTNFYDLRGRLVRLNGKNGVQTYEPYSCHYVLGECKHTYRYPNPFKDNRQIVNTSAYQNRLDGNNLFISWRLVDGKLVELPFRLGRYRLRVANQYRNRLGQEKGFRLIELTVPGQ